MSGKARTDSEEAQAVGEKARSEWEDTSRNSDIVGKKHLKALSRQEDLAKDLEKRVDKISHGNGVRTANEQEYGDRRKHGQMP